MAPSKTSESVDEPLELAESIIHTVREPLIVLDHDLRVVSANRSFYKVFKVNHEDTVGQLIYDIGNQQWDIPKLRELLETILPQKTTFDGYEVEHDFVDIGRRVMLLNARQIQRVWGKERIILLAIEDITQRKEIEAGLEKTRKELAVIKKIADEVSEFAESVIDTVRESLMVLDHDLKVVSACRSFYDAFKVRPEETLGQLIYDLGNKQWDIPKLRQLLEVILPENNPFNDYEVEADFPDIGRRTMLLNARQLERKSGKERLILLAIEDITERKRLANLLSESEERYRRLFETANDGILLLEKAEGKITHANPAITEMLGYLHDEIIGKGLIHIGFPDDIGVIREISLTLEKDGILYYKDAPIQTKTGQVIYSDIYMVDKARLVQCNIRDITKRKQAEKTIRQMAYHDSLTGLPNRKLFSDRTEIALAQAGRSQKNAAVIMLDLDNFKDINDTLGHDVGDSLLKTAAERLKAAMRKSDTVARFGGDEFVLLLPDLKGIEDASRVAQKIVESFRKPFPINTHHLIVTASIGIAVYPDDGSDEVALLKNADIAMYQAKQAGRDRYQVFKKS